MKDSPSELPGNGARNYLMLHSTGRKSASLETPRARYEEHNSKISLSRNQGYRTMRRKETSHRCWKQRGDLHNTNSRLCPNESVRLSSTPICRNKGLNVWCGR